MSASHQHWHSSAWFATWLRLARHAAFLLACAWSVEGVEYYVATGGSATNSGTIGAPLTLAKAIGNTSPAVAGDTVYIRGGTYSGNFTSELAGSAGNQITVRGYNGERASLASAVTSQPVLSVTGSYTTFRDLEIYNPSTDRANYRAEGVSVYGPGIELINLVIHDTGDGVGTWVAGTNNTVYGCLIYNGGYQGPEPDRGHGHGIYAQNNTGTKLLSDNIIWGQAFYGIQLYGAAAPINNIRTIGNIVFSNGRDNTGPRGQTVLLGGIVPASGLQFDQNMLYDSYALSVADFGYQLATTTTNADLTIRSNYFAQAKTRTHFWSSLTVSGNTFITVPDGLNVTTGDPAYSYAWNSNTYTSSATPFNFNTSYNLSFADWKTATGFDAASTYTAGAPSATVYFVRPNSYETGRANVAVYNWAGTDNVSVDLSSVCQSGRSYTVKNSANYYGPTVKTFAYASSLVSLPMTNLTVATPVGGSAPSATSPTFNAFIIEPTATIKTRGFLRKR